MAERQRISQETKAQAIAMLLAGETTAHVAAALGIPEGTVKSWKSRGAADVATVATEKKEELGELVAGYLDASLRALRAQAELAADRKWLEKQDADKLAIFHGVIADKTIRVLAALRPAGEDDASGS